MDKRTDIELVALARSGSKPAFDQLVERYQALAQRVAWGMVAEEETARDLAQEAMLQAYLSLDHLRDGSRFRSWLYGIVRNVCRSYLRDRKADWLSLEALTGGMLLDVSRLSDARIDPHSALEERERGGAVSEALDALSARDRAVARLFYDEQLSMKEIATTLGISVLAVKNRLYRARKRLREQLLRIYPEMDSTARSPYRRSNMVKSTIDRVIEEEQPGAHSAAVILRDEAGGRTLRVRMGPADAAAIEMGLRHLALPRPLTFTFMAGLLEAAGAQLEDVRIEGLKEGVLYAVARLRCGKTVRELDARPSDALALAAHTGSPIYVADEIMGKAGRDLPEDLAERGEPLTGDAPIPELLPVLPVRDAVFFPRALFPLFVGREISIRALDEAQAKDRFVFILAQRQGSVDNPQPADVYAVGTVGRLIQLLQLPDQTIRALVEGIARGRVLEYQQTQPFHLARVQVLPEEEDTTAEARALVDRFLDRYQELSDQGKTVAFPTLSGMRGQGPGQIADAIASGVSLPVEARQELLETANPNERLAKLSRYLGSPVEPDRLTGQGVTLEAGLWPKLTERARQVVFFAQEEAAQRGESFIHTEHLLLGLTRIPESVAAQVVVRLGISMEYIREELSPRGAQAPAARELWTLLTPRAYRVIELAREEASLLENNYIGTEHLLLGLVREDEGLAARTLVKLGADLKRVRQEVLEAIQTG